MWLASPVSSHHHAKTITERFVAFGATSPDTALTLAGIGRELAQIDASTAAGRDWLRRAGPNRWWVTERGQAVARGETPPPRPPFWQRYKAALQASTATGDTQHG